MGDDVMTDLSSEQKRWRFAIDRGGTFTDVIGVDPEGRFHTLKLLSSSPLYSDPAVEGIRRILNTGKDTTLSSDLIESVRLGTTVATNALLERKGGRTLLVTTKGFRDLLEIGYQSRDDIFALCIRKPETLYSDVIEVEERIDHSGKVVVPLNEGELLERLGNLKADEYDSVAVVLLHSWINPLHEEKTGEILKQAGFRGILLSSSVAREIKVVTRGNATVVDAYLLPVIGGYIRELEKGLKDVRLEFFVSAGGLVEPEGFRGREALLSGPAGGVMATAEVARVLDLKGVIGFDMGGTSTDVCRFDGELERITEKRLARIDIHTEMLNINTIAAGGGSILSFENERFLVGPDSAGADPGPACYGLGGPLTITDANLLTGRLIEDYMPRTFGPSRDAPVDSLVVREMFEELTSHINRRLSRDFQPEEVALGFLRVASEKMAMAIREISISKGVDVRDYTLLCFGGAGGQHACSVARLLDMKEIIFHPLGSLFSAYGIGISRAFVKDAITFIRLFNREGMAEMARAMEELTERVLEGVNFRDYDVLKEVDLRVKDTGHSFRIPFTNYDDMLARFKERHKRVFGFYRDNLVPESTTLRVTVIDRRGFFPAYKEHRGYNRKARPHAYQSMFTEQGWCRVPLYLRDEISQGAIIRGPALIIDSFTTIVIEEGFEAEVEEKGIIRAVLGRPSGRRIAGDDGKGADPVMLEIFNNLFMGIATEMGHTLRNTAISVNIRERLDFSCAVFDPHGGLVANAPHIPVHLGSMADTVKAVIERYGAVMQKGDAYLTNNPFNGGSHLPDLTVVYPVFSDDGRLLFFTASRGHHADIGGKTPGSMPPGSSHIEEEGVLIDRIPVLKGGVFLEDQLRQLLGNHPYPVRDLDQSIEDIKAQIAACRKGQEELSRLVERYGYNMVKRYMLFIQRNAELSVREALYRFLEGDETRVFTFTDYLDDGSVISVRIHISAGEDPPHSTTAVVDFSGTSPQHDRDNLNAPLSVTKSAILYVLRLLAGKDIPLNSGCLKAVQIVAPEGSLVNATYPAAVASGNVETSQRIVDLLLGAFGVAAASQGTMNNLLFEVAGEPTYYETIGGGSGAMDGCPGASAVQVHMTNTRITDPEIFELRHPGVRLRRFTIRRGSGGKGAYTGGDGIIREVEFLKPATVTIISERRSTAPYGMKGGGAGLRGVNLFRDGTGRITRLPHRVSLRVKPSESVIIKTPGGGGYGATP